MTQEGQRPTHEAQASAPDTAPEAASEQARTHPVTVPAADHEQPYAKLPDRIRPEDMITEQAVRDPGDPTLGGRDPERDWLLRYAG